jgi:hypothetical protein
LEWGRIVSVAAKSVNYMPFATIPTNDCRESASKEWLARGLLVVRSIWGSVFFLRDGFRSVRRLPPLRYRDYTSIPSADVVRGNVE